MSDPTDKPTMICAQAGLPMAAPIPVPAAEQWRAASLAPANDDDVQVSEGTVSLTDLALALNLDEGTLLQRMASALSKRSDADGE